MRSSPDDADDAGCFGAPVQEAAQLMLMMLAVWGHLPSESPPDADDAHVSGAPGKREFT